MALEESIGSGTHRQTPVSASLLMLLAHATPAAASGSESGVRAQGRREDNAPSHGTAVNLDPQFNELIVESCASFRCRLELKMKV